MQEFGELAQEVNTIPLLSVADRPGLKLPMEDDCLLAPNYQVNIHVWFLASVSLTERKNY